jgi:hypothetical protein
VLLPFVDRPQDPFSLKGSTACGDFSAQFKNNKMQLFALNTPCCARDRKRKHEHYRAFFFLQVFVCYRDAPRCLPG